ncbi:hypothetical protein [Streptomyces sp. TRM68367]|uniref:hypothetical protein n=1 Tax=Streptomyces sp. TRM68367 TaxID=2758415 RepID=UPI00165B985B|nr:hypothetical protein [Streptomyces sp. TRM68367]MBC9725172.1 hypothetical protein [Streptomyces sp. TRM68367]
MLLAASIVFPAIVSCSEENVGALVALAWVAGVVDVAVVGDVLGEGVAEGTHVVLQLAVGGVIVEDQGCVAELITSPLSIQSSLTIFDLIVSP